MSNQLSFYMALLRTINIYALDIKVETINGKMQLFTISIENIYVRAFDSATNSSQIESLFIIISTYAHSKDFCFGHVYICLCVMIMQI